MASAFDPGRETSWCPGCGNFAIRTALIAALDALGRPAHEILLVSGIGQAAKMPHYVAANMFNGLHGRALPVATGAKAADPGLVVIAEGGDGDMYGEGGNHLLHAIRRNPDIAVIVHDNFVYGLTKGQASPTSREGMVTPVQVEGVKAAPMDPVALAIAMDAPFVARALAGDIERTAELILAAIRHPGFALLDILQSCPSFNKACSMRWFRDHSRYVGSAHDPTDKLAAMALTMGDTLPLGIIYLGRRRASFEEASGAYRSDRRPLKERGPRLDAIRDIIAGMEPGASG